MEVKKKKFIIIIALLIIILLIPPTLIIKEVVHYKLLAKDTEEKISQINADELESILIDELENTSLNIENTSFSTTFVVCNSTNYDNQEILFIDFLYELLEQTNPYEGYILACITENTTSVPERVYIPCFKVERDDNGNVKNIIYLAYGYMGIYKDVSNIVDRVLREHYNIKSHSLDSVKYFRDKYQSFPFGTGTNYKYSKEMEVYCTDNDFGASVISAICKKSGYNVSVDEAKSDLKYNKIDLSMSSWKPIEENTTNSKVETNIKDIDIDTYNNQAKNNDSRFNITNNQKYTGIRYSESGKSIEMYMMFGSGNFEYVISATSDGKSMSLKYSGTYTQNEELITCNITNVSQTDNATNLEAPINADEPLYGTISEDGKTISMQFNDGGDVTTIDFVL